MLAGAGTVLLLRLANGPGERFGVRGLRRHADPALRRQHALPCAPAPRSHRLRALRTLDHIAIYFLIAGTYTPVASITLHGRLGWTLLVAAWAHRAGGIPFKIFFLDAPIWVSTGTYLAMGYLALLAAVPLAARRLRQRPGLARGRWPCLHRRSRHLQPGERPDPFPGAFGHHEIWHLLVLVGSGCHFAFMLLHVGVTA